MNARVEIRFERILPAVCVYTYECMAAGVGCATIFFTIFDSEGFYFFTELVPQRLTRQTQRFVAALLRRKRCMYLACAVLVRTVQMMATLRRS